MFWRRDRWPTRTETQTEMGIRGSQSQPNSSPLSLVRGPSLTGLVDSAIIASLVLQISPWAENQANPHLQRWHWCCRSRWRSRFSQLGQKSEKSPVWILIVHQSFSDLVVAGPSKTMGCARCIWSSASWLSPSVPDDGVCWWFEYDVVSYPNWAVTSVVLG